MSGNQVIVANGNNSARTYWAAFTANPSAYGSFPTDDPHRISRGIAYYFRQKLSLSLYQRSRQQAWDELYRGH